jgi:hypothetical protein
MAVAALAVAIVAVVIAALTALYSRTQAVAAKGSLAIEEDRHKVELAPRFDAEITGGNDPVLRLRLLPDQLPMVGVSLRIVQGVGVSFDEARRPPDGGQLAPWLPPGPNAVEEPGATLDGVLFPGAQMTWPLQVDDVARGGEVTLEISDLGRPGRVAAVMVSVPPRARIRTLEA